MADKTLKDMIDDALDEAYILESGHEKFDEERMLLVAMKLSGAPYSFIEQVYATRQKRKKKVA